MSEPLARRLLGMFSLQAVLTVSLIAQELLLVPLYIWHWDTSMYRDWLVLLAMAEFLVLLDLGLQTYFNNLFMARLSGGDRSGFRQTLAEASGVYGGLVLIGVLTLAIVHVVLPTDAIAEAFKVRLTDAGELFLLLAMTTVLRLPQGMLTGVYRARGEPERGLLFALLSTLTRIAAIALTLFIGGGPLGVAIAILIQTLSLSLIGGLDQHHRYAESWPRPQWPERSRLIQALITGAWYKLSALAATANVQGMVLLVSTLASDALSVLVFTTARTLTGLASQASSQITTAVSIEQSRMHGEGRTETLLRLHRFASRLATTIVAGIAGFVLIIGAELLAVWTHDKVPHDAALIATLLAAAVLGAANRATALLFYYTNRPLGMALSTGLAALIALGVAALAIPHWGALGAGVGLVIAEAIAITGVLGSLVARSLGESWWRDTVVSLALGATSLLSSMALARLATGLAEPLAGAGGWGFIGISAALWGSSALLPLYYLILTREQRARVRVLLRSGFRD